MNEIVEAYPVGYDIHPEIQGALVMKYFYSYFKDDFRDTLREKLPEIMRNHTGYNLIFTGHSLGGALAVHAAAETILSNLLQDINFAPNSDEDGARFSIYTFGQPRVGNMEFINSFYGNVTEWYRLVHHRDLVAHIPP